MTDRTGDIPRLDAHGYDARHTSIFGASPFLSTGPSVDALKARVAELELALGVNQRRGWLVARELWAGVPTIYAALEKKDGRAQRIWTNERDEALRFAREVDAEAYRMTLGETLRTSSVTRVEEHVWQ